MRQKYLLQYAVAHAEFRLPELESICQLHAIHIKHLGDFDPKRPFAIVELESEEHARLLASRCIMLKYVFHLHSIPGSPILAGPP